MSLTIRLSDEEVTALQAKAAAEGLSVEEWIKKLAEQGTPGESLVTPVEHPMSEVMREIWGDLPEEARAKLPHDGASQVDHYVYGLPKREL